MKLELTIAALASYVRHVDRSFAAGILGDA